MWLSRSSLREMNLIFSTRGFKNSVLVESLMYLPKKQLLLGRREEFANPIYILRTWDVTRRIVASGDQTDKMMKVRASLPSKGEGIKNKVQSIPLKTEVRPTGERRGHGHTLLIARGLEIIVTDVTGKVSNKIQGQQKIFGPQVEKSSLIMADAVF